MWGSLNRVFGLKTRMAAIMITLRSRCIWHLVDSVATAISQSYGIARERIDLTHSIKPTNLTYKH